MSNLLAVRVLDAAGVEYRLHRHPPVMRAADHELSGLGLERSVKTLAFVVGSGDVVLAGIPGAARLAYGALAQALGVPRSQLKPAPEDRLRALGMELGGVCPFTTDASVRVVLDASIDAWPSVHCGSGRPDVTIELSPAALHLACPQALVAVIARIEGGDPA